MIWTRMNLVLVPMFCLLCTGCGRAPSVDIIGSFFPVWMICLTLAVVLAFVVRYLLLRYRLESEVGPVALFYPSVVVLFTCLLWLIFFR
jgi:type VI protein secretion system component VasF